MRGLAVSGPRAKRQECGSGQPSGQPDPKWPRQATARSSAARHGMPRVEMPFKFDVDNGFEWVGDTEIRRELVEPALAAINDPRFAGPPR